MRAEGASVVGASGGEVIFRGIALATVFTTVVANGGTGASALGGSVTFADGARAEGTVAALAGDAGGVGGRVNFIGNAVASSSASISNAGGGAVGSGTAEATNFRGDPRLGGTVSNYAGGGAGFAGGQLEFNDRAAFDSTFAAPGFGTLQIVNIGSVVDGAGAGRTIFRDDSFARGAGLLITNNANSEGAPVGSVAGMTDFFDRSRAGQLTISNEGASVATAAGAPVTESGRTAFSNASIAENAQLTQEGGRALNGAGGRLQFFDDATAGSARIDNVGGDVTGAFGGTTAFAGRSNAANATIVNGAGQATSAGGSTVFSGNSGAGQAFISNQAQLVAVGGLAGTTRFVDSSSAQRATIDNQGGLSADDNASTTFRDHASAGESLITNFGGRAASAFGGITSFQGNATAGASTLVMAGGGTSGALGGFALFSGDASAGTATLDVRSASVSGAVGGQVNFSDRSSAGAARVIVAGSSVDHVLGPEGARVTFAGTSSAGDGRFDVGGNGFAGGGTGSVRFTANSTAGSASFALSAGLTRGGALSFEGASATELASAGAATIVNQGSSTGGPRGLAIGGQTTFVANSTAASATITKQAGTGAGSTNFFATTTAGDARIFNLGGAAGEDGGSTQFNNSASAGRAVIANQAGARGTNGFDAAGRTRFVNGSGAGEARITAEGAGSASAIGGSIFFGDNADPLKSTLVAEGGTNGGTGGRITFFGTTNSSQTRVILDRGVGAGAGGGLDISGLSIAGVAVGSIEGGGTVSLGSKRLVMWSNTADTTFSGTIRDGGASGGIGGALDVRGGAVLTLTGANTYTGGTRIGDGVFADSGKVVVANVTGSGTGSGAVDVLRGGTLSGSGVVDGHVVLHAGGTIAPGDPVTLTLNDGLTWDGGGVVRLVLGADDAGSDHLRVGSLVHGTAGSFLFDLADWGVVAGQEYDLLSFDSIAGFSLADFSTRGVAGELSFDGNIVAFTAAGMPVTAVPEPSTVLLMAGGLIGIWSSARVRRRRQAASAR